MAPSGAEVTCLGHAAALALTIEVKRVKGDPWVPALGWVASISVSVGWQPWGEGQVLRGTHQCWWPGLGGSNAHTVTYILVIFTRQFGSNISFKYIQG